MILTFLSIIHRFPAFDFVICFLVPLEAITDLLVFAADVFELKGALLDLREDI